MISLRSLGRACRPMLLGIGAAALGAVGCTVDTVESAGPDEPSERAPESGPWSPSPPPHDDARAAPSVPWVAPPQLDPAADSPAPIHALPDVPSDGTHSRFAYHDGALAQCFQGGYFAVQGDLHTHTNNSDGSYEPSTAFQVARDCGMHFFAVTDHAEGGSTGTPLDATEWAQCRAAASAATAPGAFIATCGFEVEPIRGHANVFFTDAFWSVGTRADFADKVNSEPGNGVAAQINHPCTSVVDNQWGPYPPSDGALEFPYDVAIDDNIALMEFSGAGTFACKQSEYRYLLDTGWHVAPSSNSDHHGANQGWCSEPWWRTGLWVSALTLDGVHDAIRQRRSFSGPNGSSIRLFADGCWMGSVVGGVSSAWISVEATWGGGLGSIVLVGNGGGVRHSCDCGGATSCSCGAELAVGPGSYLYAYAPRLDDGDKPLVAAPVWFRAAPTCVGECVPGQVATAGCGNCGTMSRICRGNCSWSPWGACQGSGPCAPGQSETGGCNDCGEATRQCAADCQWGPWGACQGSGLEQTMGCGNCGTQTIVCSLDGFAQATSECVGSGPCAAGTIESAACCDCGSTTRSCGGDCQWSDWSDCAGPDPADGTEACDTGVPGRCQQGRRRCVRGCLACVPVAPTEPEICDGIDNDCTGEADDGFPEQLGLPPAPLAAALVDLGHAASVVEGESSGVWAQFANVGAEPWRHGSLWLVPEPPEEPSPFWDPTSWSAFDVAAVLPDDVPPGELASFRFDVRLQGVDEGRASQRFRLVTQDGTTLMCPSPYFDLSVLVDRGDSVAPPEGAAADDRGSDGVLPAACGCRLAPTRTTLPPALLLAIAVGVVRLRRGRRPGGLEGRIDVRPSSDRSRSRATSGAQGIRSVGWQ